MEVEYKKKLCNMCPKSDAKSMLRRVFQKNINCIAALYKLITEINAMEIVCPATKALGSTGHYLLVYLVHLQDKVHMADLQVSNLKLTE